MSHEDRTANTLVGHEKKVKLAKFLAVLAILGGLAMIAGGATVWAMVSNQLADEQIFIPSKEEAADDPAVKYFYGKQVKGPLTAFHYANIVRDHALAATDGKTFAELDREDPVRQTAMTASFLRSSLFTSVVSFGVSFMAIGVGLLMIFLGYAVHRVAVAPVVIKTSEVTNS